MRYTGHVLSRCPLVALLTLATLAGCSVALPLSGAPVDSGPDTSLPVDSVSDLDGAPASDGPAHDLAADSGVWVPFLADDFDDGTINDKLWGAYNVNNAPPPKEADGVLTIAPPGKDPGCASDPACYAGLYSWEDHDFRSARVQVEVLGVLTAVDKDGYAAGDTGLYVGLEGSFFYGIYQMGGMLYAGFGPSGGGSWEEKSTPYDADQHRYWRVSHDPQSDMIRFWTSSDAKSWTALHALPTQIDLSQVELLIEAGVWDAAANPGTAVFDNVLAERRQ